MMKNAWMIIALALTFSAHLQAAKLPKPLDDKRLTSTKYTPDNVVRVRAAVGFITLIQLEKGEAVKNGKEGIGIGDKKAWDITVQDNNLFFKPIAEEPDTNISFSTTKGRTYAFNMTLSKYPHFLVRMEYEKEIKIAEKKFDIPCWDGKTNFEYSKWGDEPLAPSYMWDDGRFTCLKFTGNAELPVAYQIATDGSESLINYHFEKDTMILHGISKEFRLRLGEQVLGLKSDHAAFAGYNKKASSVKATRELRDE